MTYTPPSMIDLDKIIEMASNEQSSLIEDMRRHKPVAEEEYNLGLLMLACKENKEAEEHFIRAKKLSLNERLSQFATYFIDKIDFSLQTGRPYIFPRLNLLTAPLPEDALIRERLEVLIESKGGRITFADYIKFVQYDPLVGYYSKQVEIHRERDREKGYVTPPEIHSPHFGLIARELYSMWIKLGKPENFVVIEPGPGNGTLCNDILDYVKEFHPDFYKNMSYFLIEITPRLIEKQKERVKHPNVHWLNASGYEPLLRDNSIEGCFLSTFFVDTFPPHLIVNKADPNVPFLEVYITIKDGSLTEELGELSDDRIKEYLALGDFGFFSGKRKHYININALFYLEEAYMVLKRGFVRTVGYAMDQGKESFHDCRVGDGVGIYIHSGERGIQNPYQEMCQMSIFFPLHFKVLSKKGSALGFRDNSCTTIGEYFSILVGEKREEPLFSDNSCYILKQEKL